MEEVCVESFYKEKLLLKKNHSSIICLKKCLLSGLEM